jgi:uncharacterized protein
MSRAPAQDLRWLLLTPPLLSGKGAAPCQLAEFSAVEIVAIAAWLSIVESDPSPLMAHLEASQPASENPLRIGRYAERLLHFFLTHGPTHRLVAANVVVRKRNSSDPRRPNDHTTLGEIDFLVENSAGDKLHWELALKYFLALDMPRPTVADYMGPDGTEALTRKIAKMDRQLRQQLPAPFDRDQWVPQAFTRGCLFYHQPPLALPVAVHPDHHRGFWMSVEQVECSAATERFVLLQREQWLAPQRWHHAIDSSTLIAELHQHWKLQQTRPGRTQTALSAQMVARVAVQPNMEGTTAGPTMERTSERWGAGPNGPFVEIDRGFVLPPGMVMMRSE